MMSRIVFCTFVACIASAAFGQDAPKPDAAQEQAMMEAWMKAATPGAAHQRIMKLAGTFNVKSQFRMGPDAPEQSSEGKTVNTVILNGRFLQGDFSGQMMGQPFKGMYLMGFDNLRQQYVSAWADDMSTSLMHGFGTIDDTGKTITWTFDYLDPMTQKPAQQRHVTTIESDDRYIYEIFDKTPDGKEFRSVLLTYERAK
jgi:hypothetical protein